MAYRIENDERSVLVVGIQGKVAGVERDTGRILWTNPLEGGGYGEVFLAIRGYLILASAAGRALFCLDIRSGATRWKVKTTGTGRAAIVAEPEAVFVAKGGYLDCFAIDGTELWSQPLHGLGMGRVALGFPGNVAQADDIGQE